MHNKKYAVAVNSCTDAIFFALKCLNLKHGDEVLVTNFSYVASASAIVRAGLVPIFVDINEDYNMNLKNAQMQITKKQKYYFMCIYLVKWKNQNG